MEHAYSVTVFVFQGHCSGDATMEHAEVEHAYSVTVFVFQGHCSGEGLPNKELIHNAMSLVFKYSSCDVVETITKCGIIKLETNDPLLMSHPPYCCFSASRIWNCHVTSAPSLYRLSEDEAKAVFVQPQFPVIICCSGVPITDATVLLD